MITASLASSLILLILPPNPHPAPCGYQGVQVREAVTNVRLVREADSLYFEPFNLYVEVVPATNNHNRVFCSSFSPSDPKQ